MNAVLDIPSASVSIIVTSYSYGRMKDLIDLIKSVREQKQLDRLEIVLVVERDKRLFDEIRNLLSGMADLKSKVLFFERLSGMSEARNKGAEASIGKYLAFLDDDVVLDRSWSINLISTMQNTNAIAITGPSRPIWVDRELDWWPSELSWIIGSTEWFHSKEAIRIRNVWGNNMIVKREEFSRVGGFRKEFGLQSASRRKWFDPPSEDVDISFRLRRSYGDEILYVPGLSVGHKVSQRKISWRFIAQRSFSTGYQRHAIARLYSQDNFKSIKLFLLSNTLD